MDILEKKIVELDDSLYKEKQGIAYRYVLETIEKPLIEHALETYVWQSVKGSQDIGNQS